MIKLSEEAKSKIDQYFAKLKNNTERAVLDKLRQELLKILNSKEWKYAVKFGKMSTKRTRLAYRDYCKAAKDLHRINGPMIKSRSQRVTVCRKCGARNRSTAFRCYECGAVLLPIRMPVKYWRDGGRIDE